MICNAYKKRGQSKLDQDKVDWLVSTETLQSMSHLSLRKRALVVKEKFGLKTLDKNTLRSCYQRNGVRFRRADYKYFKTHAENKDLK